MRIICIAYIVGIICSTLWLAQGAFSINQSAFEDAPNDWKTRILEGNLLYTLLEPTDQQLMATVGNGYVASVINSNTYYIAGVYNGKGVSQNTPSHRARIPAEIPNIVVSNHQTPIGSALDLEKGVFYRRFLLPNDGNTSVEQRIYAHRSLPNLFIHEIEVETGHNNIVLQLKSSPGPSSSDISFQPERRKSGQNFQVYSGQINQPEEVDSKRTSVAYATTVVDSQVSIEANTKTTLFYIAAFSTSLDSSNIVQDVTNRYKQAMTDPESLLESHIAAWKEVWQSRITVDGDLNLAQSINSSLYYILSSVRDDWPWSPSPGGLASSGYNGHIFWDSETWMYPTFALMYPEIAKGSFIQYRYNKIQGAKSKAQSYHLNYTGLMFPWESAFSGEEVCPLSAPTGQLEQHISGDISFALEQYWRLTYDINWLSSTAYPIMSGIADFWASRVTKESNGQYVINGVIPPDEYAVNVNNSVYTNVVASYALQFATKAAKTLGITPPTEWMEIAQNIKIPFDENLQIHPEYDGYNGETIKQADVVLLGFPLMFDNNATIRYNDLVYYSDRTDIKNGPAMTWAMHAVAWIELGYEDSNTDKVFKQSYSNIHPPFNIWTETPTGGTVNFITGAGGFLQGVWGGYAGLRINEDHIFIKPVLPSGVSSMQLIGVQYLGNIIDIRYNQTATVFSTRKKMGNAVPLVVQYGSNRITLSYSTDVTIRAGAATISKH